MSLNLEESVTKTIKTVKATKAAKKVRKTVRNSIKDSLRANKEFSSHLKTIRKAKERTKSFTKIWKSSYKAAESTLKIVWEQVFDYLCANPSASIEDLTKIAGIIHKLTACFSQIKTLEQKSEDASKQDTSSESLSPDVLKQIEHELNLL